MFVYISSILNDWKLFFFTALVPMCTNKFVYPFVSKMLTHRVLIWRQDSRRPTFVGSFLYIQHRETHDKLHELVGKLTGLSEVPRGDKLLFS